MQLVTKKLSEIKPYKNNPRKNDMAVDDVAESIRQCEYNEPIVVDENNVILCGQTRLKALLQHGYDEAEVIVKEGLTEKQKKKYRLLDNQTSSKSEWDYDKLMQELDGMDFEGFDFGFDEKTKGEKEEIPGEIEFTEVLGEENNYIVLKFDNSVDWLQVESLFGLKKVKAYSTRNDGKITDKMTRAGVGRVINGIEFLNSIGGEL